MALPTKLHLQIVAADRLLVNEQVDEVEIPAADGYMGVLPGHTPMLAMMQVGEMWYRKGAEKSYVVLAFGFAEILPDRVTILAQMAETAEEIDIERAKEAHREAQQRVLTPQTEKDMERARIAMMTALIRMQVAERARIRPRG